MSEKEAKKVKAETKDEKPKADAEEKVAKTESSDDEPKVAEVEEPSAEQEESDKRLGVKESAADNDGLAIKKDEATDDDSEGDEALPSFFVKDEDRTKVEVDILSDKKTGKIQSVSRVGLGINFKQFDYMRHSVEEFEFSVPSYEAMSTYRQRCVVYRQEMQQTMVDKLALRNFLLVWHLKDWSLKDTEGNKVELEFDEEGALSDGAMKKVYSLQTTLIDVVLTVFEKDLMIT